MEESLGGLVERVREEVFSPSADMHSFLPSSAYETAWVAMIPHPERRRRPMFPKCLDWVLRNQSHGGSWGEHDLTVGSLTATLACIIALKTWNVGSMNIDEGLRFLHANTDELLVKQCGGIPRWFAVVFPGMLELAKAKGLKVFPEGYTRAVRDVFDERERIFKTEETSMSSGGRHLPQLLSYLEALPAIYRENHEDILKHKREDGSLFHSPSATACAFMITGRRDLMEYLEAMVRRCGSGVPPRYPVEQDLVKLCLVDHLIRLGCREHFTEEIGDVMDHIYENCDTVELQPSKMHDLPLQIFRDSLDFHLLRSHGHRISPERFCWFMRDPQMLLHIEENYQDFLEAMHAVYRATHLMYPEEEELQDAKTFSQKILQMGLPGEDFKASSSSAFSDFQEEIEHELKHLWLARMDHLEHRMYIERSKGYNLCIGKASSIRLSFPDDIFQLAARTFMTRQSVYKAELEELKRWSQDTGLASMGFGREKTAYCYFLSASSVTLPLYSELRVMVAKCSILVTVADDFFDEEGSLDELRTLTESVQRWESEGLSGHAKVIFDALDDLVRDISLKIFNQRGHDIKSLIKDIKEMADGKLNTVPLYLKENPKATVEDAIAYINNKLDRIKKELLEVAMSDDHTEVPKEWKQVHLCALKGFQMLFNTSNAFDSPTALLENISQAIYEPLVVDDQRMALPPFVPSPHESNKENTGISLDGGRGKELLQAKGRPQGVNRRVVNISRAMPSEIKRSLNYVRPKSLHKLQRPSSYWPLALPSANCPRHLFNM